MNIVDMLLIVFAFSRGSFSMQMRLLVDSICSFAFVFPNKLHWAYTSENARFGVPPPRGRTPKASLALSPDRA